MRQLCYPYALVPLPVKRLRLAIRGAVQGVGFRPFVYRLASDLHLSGWVNNSPQGVFLEVEGPQPQLEQFLLRIEAEKPPRSSIHSLEPSWLDPVGFTSFEIRPSETGGGKTVLVLPDIATCPDCLREILDSNNRRYFYPFTNCTNCGPRFTIIESLPYDRANTSMKRFTMCPACQAEYDNPLDRRFHAQPNACPVCGPQLELWDRAGNLLAGAGQPEAPLSSRPASLNPPIPTGLPHSAQGCDAVATMAGPAKDNLNPERVLSLPQQAGPLLAAAETLRAGKILALKGLGGFHLMVAAHDDLAVQRLRELKHREEKPFALMFPSLDSIKAACEVSPLEARLLCSPEAPIVLLRRKPGATVPHLADSLAPNNPNLGVMLPYTPLHHLLLKLLGFPVVATSGNLSDEPICIDEHDALARLGEIADLFLVHNRPIVRHVDDSIVRVMAGRELVVRRARGYAPLPVPLPSSARAQPAAPSVLAVGAHLKNTIALSVGPHAFISQHIGDLETDQAFEAFRRVIADFQDLYETRPAIVAADAHPDYLSTGFARKLAAPAGASPGAGPRLVSIQHHLAHVLSCLAENELAPPVLGVSWDGTGYGLDGTVWGGEFFLVTETSAQRVAHLRQFRLPGGDRAVKEPRRTALGLLFEMSGPGVFARTALKPVSAFCGSDLRRLQAMLSRKLNSPLTSSVGRLFDGVASLLGLRQTVRFEGQAAMELEFALEGIHASDHYSFVLQEVSPEPKVSAGDPSAPFILDWAPLLEALLQDLERGVPVAQISARFHNALVEAIIAVVRRVGQQKVLLSGGCFQNRYLTEHVIDRLREEGFQPYWHQRVPPNDGGIALGQIVAALKP